MPGWEPELLHPPGASCEPGLIFRSRTGRGEVVWIVARLDPAVHRIGYHRVEPGHHVARVDVRWAALGEARTAVRVSYVYVGLSEAGNDEISAMTRATHDERMRQWKALIDEHLTSGGVTR